MKVGVYMKNKSKNVIIAICIVIGLYIIYQLLGLLFVGYTMTFGTPVNDKKLYDTPDECISATVNEKLTSQKSNVIANSIYVYEAEDYYYQFYLADDNLTVSYFVLGKQKNDSSTEYFTESLQTAVQYHNDKWYIIGDCYYRIAESKDEIVNFNEVKPEITEFTVDTVHGKETKYLLFAVQ